MDYNIYDYYIMCAPAGDTVTLDFTEAIYDVNEGDGTVDVCMELGGLPPAGLECDIVIPLILQDDKASEYNTSLCIRVCKCLPVYMYVCALDHCCNCSLIRISG